MFESVQDWLSNIPVDWLKEEKVEDHSEPMKDMKVDGELNHQQNTPPRGICILWPTGKIFCPPPPLKLVGILPFFCRLFFGGYKGLC